MARRLACSSTWTGPCEVGTPQCMLTTIVHEILVGSAVLLQSIESVSPGTKSACVRFYKSNDTQGSDTLWAALD